MKELDKKITLELSVKSFLCLHILLLDLLGAEFTGDQARADFSLIESSVREAIDKQVDMQKVATELEIKME